VTAAASGDMLGLIFFSLVFGIALTRISSELAAPVIRLLEGIAHVVMVIIGFAMRVAPIGVAGLIFSVTAKFGFDLLQSLSLYVITALAGLALHQFGVLGLLARVLDDHRVLHL
jgi:DAACS family dicarboxylate/amino acid:cation (Na+ or H+) symporter